MTDWAEGMAARIVQYDDATRQPRPGGRVIPATVTGVAGLYVVAEFRDPDWPRPKPTAMAFYAESGWVAWDGLFCWRLEPQP